MNPELNHITVSTDVLGLFSDPESVQQLYEKVGFSCGLEVVLMNQGWQTVVESSRGRLSSASIDGVHIRLGSSPPKDYRVSDYLDWLKVAAADMLIPAITGLAFPPVLPLDLRLDMLGSQQDHSIYVNTHNASAKQDYSNYLRYAKFAFFSYLTIENGISPKDIQKTLDLIRQFRDDGAERTTGTFDLVHAIKSLSDGDISFEAVTTHWSRMLSMLSPEFHHLHLPIGVNNDSLPIFDMIAERNMLSDLAQVIRSRNVHITIENQHNLLFGANINIEIDRLKRIRQGLLTCNLPV